MNRTEERRAHKRKAYRFPLHFIVLSSEAEQFQRIRTNGEIVDTSSSGIGILTDFPLLPGHVLEWDDRHRKGNLHLAIVKWSLSRDDRCRAGLVLI